MACTAILSNSWLRFTLLGALVGAGACADQDALPSDDGDDRQPMSSTGSDEHGMTTQASSTGDGTDASSGGEIGTSSAQSTGTTGDEDPSSSSEGGGQPIVSFESDVRPLFEQHCDTVCHAVDGAPFDYDALMVTAMFCDLPLVTPGVPEESALWIKLTEDVDDSPVLQCGREMPPLGEGSLRFVDPEAAEVVRQWIASGALP